MGKRKVEPTIKVVVSGSNNSVECRYCYLDVDLTKFVDSYDYHDFPGTVWLDLTADDVDRLIAELQVAKDRLNA